MLLVKSQGVFADNVTAVNEFACAGNGKRLRPYFALVVNVAVDNFQLPCSKNFAFCLVVDLRAGNAVVGLAKDDAAVVDAAAEMELVEASGNQCAVVVEPLALQPSGFRLQVAVVG